MTIRETILGRWKPTFDVPRLAATRKAMERALDANSQLNHLRDAVGANPALSPVGRTAEMRAFVTKDTAAAIHHGRKVAAEARAGLATWYTRLQPPKPDPKDVPAALLRGEMRTMMRGMTAAERAKLLLSDTSELSVLQAVLEAPLAVSAVSAADRQRAVETYVARTHPAAVAEIQEMEEAVQLLDTAIEAAVGSARTVTAFSTEKGFVDFIDETKPADAKAVTQLTAPPTEFESPDALYNRLMAEGRADIAAL